MGREQNETRRAFPSQEQVPWRRGCSPWWADLLWENGMHRERVFASLDLARKYVRGVDCNFVAVDKVRCFVLFLASAAGGGGPSGRGCLGPGVGFGCNSPLGNL